MSVLPPTVASAARPDSVRRAGVNPGPAPGRNRGTRLNRAMVTTGGDQYKGHGAAVFRGPVAARAYHDRFGAVPAVRGRSVVW